MSAEAAGATDVGRRPNNEDTYGIDAQQGVFVVADGMGGYEGGEVASALVRDAVLGFGSRCARDADATWPCGVDPTRSLLENRALAAMCAANGAVRVARQGRLADMGATAVALWIERSVAAVAHVGDSRVYLLRKGKLTRLTRDHSFVEDAASVGAVSEIERPAFIERFGHVVTRAIGPSEHVQAEARRVALEAGDVFLLCSDGVCGVLDEGAIAHTLECFSPAVAAEALVAESIAKGGSDNATALVVRVSPRAGRV